VILAARARPAVFLNGLSLARMVAVPIVMALLLGGRDSGPAYTVTAVVFALAAATDFLDGYLARNWGATSKLGSFLDTTADKLLVTGPLFALVAVDRVSAWIAFVIVGRELLVLGLRGVAAAEGVVFPPSIWGKLKANVQFLAIFLAIGRWGDPLGPLFLDEWAMLAAAAITVASGVEYLVHYASALKPERGPGAQRD
jgi:CDP-diacylglycerol--glycerol-3-phosphate 3-phosphatidyltransferase